MFVDAYTEALREAAPSSLDRLGLYTIIMSMVEVSPKRRDLTKADVLSNLLAYEKPLRRFCDLVQVLVLPEGGFQVLVDNAVAPTYRELKYGSMWFDPVVDVDNIIVAKLFWGAGI